MTLETLKALAALISETFSPQVECVIHDLTKKGYPIAAIYNGEISQRQVGDKTVVFNTLDEDIFAVDSVTNYNFEIGGKVLKSSSLVIKEDGRVKYALSINVDNSYIQEAIDLLTRFSNYKPQTYEVGDSQQAPITKELVKNEFLKSVMKNNLNISSLTKDHKKKIILDLKQSGFLNRRGVVPHVSELLGVSKMTIYNYLKSE